MTINFYMRETTWREMIEYVAEHLGEDVSTLQVAPNDDAIDVIFDNGHGSIEGPKFLAWTTNYVYFPVDYDGFETVGSAPRNPVKDGQEHVGRGGS